MKFKLIDFIIFNRNKKIEQINNSDRVKHLSEKAISLFDNFKKAHDELQNINNELEEIIQNETERIVEIENNRERAINELEMNRKLQEKLADFIR